MTNTKPPFDKNKKAPFKKSSRRPFVKKKAAIAEREKGLPTKEELLKYIQESNDVLTKRDLAHAFGITGQDRTTLRVMLRELSEEGGIEKSPSKSYALPNTLPASAQIEITGLNEDGELIAEPLDWFGRGPKPAIYVLDKKKDGGGLKKGDIVLARLKKTGEAEYEAKVIKAGDEDKIDQVVGIFKTYKGAGYVYPTNKKIKEDYFVPPEYCDGLSEGDLVVVVPLPPSSKYPKSKNPSRVLERIGDKDDPKLISLIAIHTQGIPTVFPPEVIRESESLSEPDLSGGREDLRQVPLVTIDGADARDFDDAVFAEPDTDPRNEGGWRLMVAIADVSYYVRPFSALDREAFERGNSTYFADRVVPMLPERLSNDLCSLRPLVNRACLVAHMVIDRNARLTSWRFARGLMRSAARLTYEQVQEAKDGTPDDTTGPLMDLVIHPLYKAYGLLKRARELRGALELDLPERKAIIKDGIVTAIVPRQRLDSHQLIEEFMILANVAAAEELERKKAPCLYRVHDRPSFDRIESTRGILKDMGYSLPKTDDLHPKSLNHLLKLSTERGEADLVHTLLLRTQSQAIYHPDNIGHFGLALEKYAHFTSPIRRYADLIVHRSLVKADHLGEGGLSAQEAEGINDIAEHISVTERRSMIAERDVMDRFTAQYLQGQVGKIFPGKISSVTHFGLFVNLDESGADGIVPMRNLPGDFYVHDEARHMLVGKRTRRTFRLADRVAVRLLEADPMRGSTVFEIVDGTAEDAAPGRPHHRRPDKSGHRGQKPDGDKPRGARGNAPRHDGPKGGARDAEGSRKRFGPKGKGGGKKKR